MLIYMTKDCQGPCLLHCYYKNSIFLLLIGFIIGFSNNKIKNFILNIIHKS